MALTERQEALLKQSWEVLKQNIPGHSLRLFALIIEAAPESKYVFSFLKDSNEIPENNPKLKAHAAVIFKTICESATELRQKGQAVWDNNTLKRLGSIHLKNKITDPHFEVMKGALLGTIKEAVKENWSDEMGCAWTEAYNQLVATIKAEMKE
uniref:Anaerobic nitrite reductase SYMA n=1 Tax=Casuarina glauca TaxID=3522 RepID=HBPA_CASGL|nr:RecName: Full=Hemoglobin A [Casuarina glauca]CAA54774.1 haemoglobin [Casuarina glauca]